MDSISLFIKNAVPAQMLFLAIAFVIWCWGGSLLKKRLLQRLQSENNESGQSIQLEDIKFEDIALKEWAIFAMLTIISLGLVALVIYAPIW